MTGSLLIQSSDIALYLDEAFPDPPLQPGDPGARATMREWMAEEGEYLFPLVVTLSFNLMMKLRSAGFGMKRLEEWSSRHPDRERAQDYLRRVSGPPDRDAVDAASSRFAWHMTHLEDTLGRGGGPWICGGEYSLADICVAPILDRVESLDLGHPVGGPAGGRRVVRTNEGPPRLPPLGTALGIPHVGPEKAGAARRGGPGRGGGYVSGGVMGARAHCTPG